MCTPDGCIDVVLLIILAVIIIGIISFKPLRKHLRASAHAKECCGQPMTRKHNSFILRCAKCGGEYYMPELARTT